MCSTSSMNLPKGIWAQGLMSLWLLRGLFDSKWENNCNLLPVLLFYQPVTVFLCVFVCRGISGGKRVWKCGLKITSFPSISTTWSVTCWIYWDPKCTCAALWRKPAIRSLNSREKSSSNWVNFFSVTLHMCVSWCQGVRLDSHFFQDKDQNALPFITIYLFMVFLRDELPCSSDSHPFYVSPQLHKNVRRVF